MKKYILIIFGFCFASFCSTNVLTFENNVQTKVSQATSVACSRNSEQSVSNCSRVSSKRRSRRRGAHCESRLSNIVCHSVFGCVFFSAACAMGLCMGAFAGASILFAVTVL